MRNNYRMKKSVMWVVVWIALVAVAEFTHVASASSSLPQVAVVYVKDRAVRGYVNELWPGYTDGFSTAQQDTLLESKYPHSSVTWKSVVCAVHATNEIALHTRESDLNTALKSMADFAKGQFFDYSLGKIGLGVISPGIDVYSLLDKVWDSANKAAIESQVKSYFYAREAGLSNGDIVNQVTEGANGSVDLYVGNSAGNGWIKIVTVGETSHEGYLFPVDISPKRVWQIASFMWGLKQDPNKFAQEKAVIGGQLKRGLAGLNKTKHVSKGQNAKQLTSMQLALIGKWDLMQDPHAPPMPNHKTLTFFKNDTAILIASPPSPGWPGTRRFKYLWKDTNHLVLVFPPGGAGNELVTEVRIVGGRLYTVTKEGPGNSIDRSTWKRIR
jgi:hypothetical protein